MPCPTPARSHSTRLVPFCTTVFRRVWRSGQLSAPGRDPRPRSAPTVTAALRAMGLATERRFTGLTRVLNRATWSTRQGSQDSVGSAGITFLVPPGATIVLGADDTVERRSGRKITAKGCYRDAVRSTKKHVIRCFGLKPIFLPISDKGEQFP